MAALDQTPVRGEWRVWLMAARPRTLPVAVAPVVVGTAVAAADGGLRGGPALAALSGALLLQIASNLANDLFDHERGADTAERIGPARVSQLGLLDPARMRLGIALVLLLALAVGGYLAAVDASRISPPSELDDWLRPAFHYGLRLTAYVTATGLLAEPGRDYVQPWRDAVMPGSNPWA